MNAPDRRLATRPRAFAASRAHDGWLLLAGLLFIWTAILMGCGPGAMKQLSGEGPARPFHLHLHAFAFFGWLVLLSTQVALARTRRVTLHRRLGVGGAVLAAAMVVIGTWTALASVPGRIARNADPGFVVVPLVDMILFAGLVTAAMLQRRDKAAHSRLVLLATLQLTGAGFGRWLGPTLGPATADWGAAGAWIALYGLLFAGVAAIGLYDLATRGRVHRAWAAGAAAMLAGSVAATALLVSADWTAFVIRMGSA